MKNLAFFLLLVLTLTARGTAQTAVTGGQLDIGDNHIYSDQSGAVGYNNEIAPPMAGSNIARSLAVGEGNLIWANNSMAVGSGNGVYGFSIPDCSFAFGNLNYVEKANSLAGGVANTITDYGEGAATSFVFGSYNLSGQYGNNDAIFGYANVSHSSNSTTLGRGLINSWNDSTTIGRYNSTAITGALFIVGSGSNASNRANVFEIYANGNVRITKRQGDILMGDFGNPE